LNGVYTRLSISLMVVVFVEQMTRKGKKKSLKQPAQGLGVIMTALDKDVAELGTKDKDGDEKVADDDDDEEAKKPWVPRRFVKVDPTLLTLVMLLVMKRMLVRVIVRMILRGEWTIEILS
jgi:hypothetical protein